MAQTRAPRADGGDRLGSISRLGPIQQAALAILTLAAAMFGHGARAEDITFAVISPHEYDLPVNFQPFNVFVQYGEWNDGAQQYNSAGNTVNGPGTHLYEGLSKYVHFWTWAAIPNVGFAYEIIEPEVRITGSNLSVSGFADPLTGPAIWIKPTKTSTFGIQNFLQIPIGGSQVTNHYWANYSSFFFDYQHPMFDITGDLGMVVRSNYHDGITPDIDEGTSFHTNIRVGYPNSSFVEPFLAVDWETTSPSHYGKGLGEVPGSGWSETAAGGGLRFTVSKTAWLNLHYSHTLAAHNTPQTDAGYLEFVYLW